MAVINRDNILGLLERAVQEKGADYQYPFGEEEENGPSCLYVIDGAPACIIGQIISYEAPELLPEISKWERTVARNPSAGTAVNVLNDQFPEIFDSPETLSIAQSAQRQQDNYGTWGAALEEAREREARFV